MNATRLVIPNRWQALVARAGVYELRCGCNVETDGNREAIGVRLCSKAKEIFSSTDPEIQDGCLDDHFVEHVDPHLFFNSFPPSEFEFHVGPQRFDVKLEAEQCTYPGCECSGIYLLSRKRDFVLSVLRDGELAIYTSQVKGVVTTGFTLDSLEFYRRPESQQRHDFTQEDQQ